MKLPVNHFIMPTVPALNYWNKKPVFSGQKVGKPFPEVKKLSFITDQTDAHGKCVIINNYFTGNFTLPRVHKTNLSTKEGTRG